MASAFGGQRSIQLSYGCLWNGDIGESHRHRNRKMQMIAGAGGLTVSPKRLCETLMAS